MSDPAERGAAEQAVRQEHEHDHDDDVGRDVLQAGADVAAAQGLDQPDQEAAQHRARDAREPAQHRRGERFDEQHEADVGIEQGDGRHQDRGRAGDRRADREGDHVDRADLDADSLAALALSAVACIMRPSRVNLKNTAKASITASAPASTTSCWGTMMRPASEMGGPPIRGGKGMKSPLPPQIARAMPLSTNDRPMVASSMLTTGWSSSGRNAMRSATAPIANPAITANSRAKT